jgi:hypothetical protein
LNGGGEGSVIYGSEVFFKPNEVECHISDESLSLVCTHAGFFSGERNPV